MTAQIRRWVVAVAAMVVCSAGLAETKFSKDQIGVCSWTWHSDMRTALDCMEKGGYKGMQLALAPWLLADTPHNDTIIFGDDEGDATWQLIKDKIAAGSLNVMSTMINFPKEDYTTLHSISNTQAYMYGVRGKWPDADAVWEDCFRYTIQAAKMTQELRKWAEEKGHPELGPKYLTTESGFIEIDPDLMFERVKAICEECEKLGVTFLIESGPQTGAGLTGLLRRLNDEGITNVGVNYDPGDDELFGSEGAVTSFDAMKPWIRQCHIKDCKEKAQRATWNEDCPWGEGYVSSMPFSSGYDFLAHLCHVGYTGDILFEYLTGDATLTDRRKQQIQSAMDAILAATDVVEDKDKWMIVRNGETNEFPTLSAALRKLQDGDTLSPFLAGDKATFAATNLNPVFVNCPFIIRYDNVTVDLRHRALTKSVAYDGFVEMGEAAKSHSPLLLIGDAKGVTVKNGFLFGTTWREDPTLTAADKRALYVSYGANVTVSNCAIFAAALANMIKVFDGSRLAIVDSYLDGQGDGSENTICVTGSTLVMKNVKGLWNPGNFWGVTDGVVDSLDAITGEQFVLEDGTLVLNNTSISNTITHWSNGYLAKPVVVSGETNKLVMGKGARIVAIGKDGETAPVIAMKSPTVDYPKTGLSTPGKEFEANKEIVAASSLASVALVSEEPPRYRVVTDAEQIKRDFGVTSITVEKPWECTDGAIESCITVGMTDDSFLLELYGYTPGDGYIDVASFLPSNALTATTLASDLKWVKGLNERLHKFAPELADFISAFSNVAEHVTGGVAVCDVPDAEAADGLGKFFLCGIDGEEGWNLLTNMLTRVGEIETSAYPAMGMSIVKLKPTGRIALLLGGRDPELAFIPCSEGRSLLSAASSASVREQYVEQVKAGLTLLANPTFLACAGDLVDPKSNGFRYISPDFLRVAGEGVHRMAGFSPDLITGLGEFWMFSTKTYNDSAKTAAYLTRMPKGASGTVEAAGRLALRFFENLHPELSGLVKFAEGYKPSAEAKERLVQMSDALLFLRDTLGVEGLDFTAEEPQLGVAKTDVRFGAERDDVLVRLLANGRSGQGVAEKFLPATTVAAWGFQPDAETAIGILDAIFTRLGLTEVAETVRAYKNRGENFAPDVALAVTLGDEEHEHEGLNFVVAQQLLDKNLWMTMQIALERRGFTLEVQDTGVIVCIMPVQQGVETLLPNLEPALSYDPKTGVVVFSSSRASGRAAIKAGRDGTSRLVESETFLTQMGGTFPDHQTFRYVSPEADEDLVNSLGEVLNKFVPESLIKAIRSFDVSAVWSTGVGNVELTDAQILPGQTIYVHKGRTSSSLYESGKRVLDAAIAALAESVSLAYPYDYTRARRFASPLVSLSVDSVDEHGKCRVRLIRRATEEGAQDITIDGQITMPEDKTVVTQHEIAYKNLTVKFILSSEGVFGFDAASDGRGTHTFILRESLLRPDFGDGNKGMSAEEIDQMVKAIWVNLGITNIVVKEPHASETEDVVHTRIDIETTENSALRKFFDLEPDPDTVISNIVKYLPANCLMATVCNCDLAWAKEANAALGKEFPDVAALFSAFGDLAEGISGGIATAIVPDSEAKTGLGCKLLAGVKDIEVWHALTNRLMRFNDIVRVDCINDFGDADVYLNPKGVLAELMGGRQPVLSFGSCQYYKEDEGKYQIAYHSSTNVYMDEAMYVYPKDRADQKLLINDPTFLKCAGPFLKRSQKRGFKYVSPDFVPALGKAALDLLGLPEEILDLEEFWDFSIIETDDDREEEGDHILIISRMPRRAQELLEAIGRLGVNLVGNLLPSVKGTVKFDEAYEPSAAAKKHIADLVNTFKSVRETLGVTGLDYRYQPETAQWRVQAGIPETGDEFYATLLSVGTTDENSAFLRLVAAGEAGENIAENYLPDSAATVWAFQPDAATWIRAVSKVFARLGLEDISDLLAETFPERFDGHSCAIAITTDETDLRKAEGGELAYATPGILVAARAGTDKSFRTLEWILEGKGWVSENTDDLMVLRREGEEDGIRLAYSVPEGMLIVATSQKVLDATLAAGLKGSHRLCDSKDFRRVMGTCWPHNTLRYQNDGMLGRLAKQVANIFADVVPEGLITQILGADILNTAEFGVGVKDGNTFFRYGRSPKSSFETSLPLAKAAFQTLAEAAQAVYPYDGTKARVFESVFYRNDIDVADADGWTVKRRRWLTDSLSPAFVESDLKDETRVENTKSIQQYDTFTDLALFSCKGDAETGILSVAFERDEEPELGIAIHIDGADENGVIVLKPNTPVEIPVTVTPATATLTAKNLPCGLSLKKVTLDKKAKTYSWVLKGNEHHVKTFDTVFTATLGKNRKTVETYYSFKVENYKSDAIRIMDTYDFTAGVAVNQYLDLTAVGCSVSGLPSGLKFDKKTGLISGTPATPGDFLVTFTKKVGKVTEKATATFAVAGTDAIAVDIDFGTGEEGVVGSRSRTADSENSNVGLGLQTRTISVYAGVKVSYPISTLGLDGVATTVTAKGLPSGLKLVKTAVYVDPTAKRKVVDHYEYAIEGVPTAVSKIDKKTGEAVPTKVVINATNKYKWTGSKAFEMTVVALPGWAVGTFDGAMTGVDGTNTYGKFNGTVSEKGKISLKLTYTSQLTDKGETATFSVTGFERYNEKTGEFVIKGTVKTKAVTRELNGVVFEDPVTGLGRMQLVDDDTAELGIFDGVQNGWKLKDTDLPSFPTGSKALKLVASNANENVTLKFGAKGVVSFSGKVAGDTKMVSVNGSAQLLPYAYGENVLFAKTLVYVAPKSGLSSGFIKAYDLAFWIGEDGKVESVGTILRGGQIAEVAKNVTDTTYVVRFSREDADVTAGQFTVRVAGDGIVKASGTIDGLSYSGTSDLVINSYGGIEIPVVATDKKGDVIVFKIDAPAVEEADVVELNIANVSLSKGETLVPAQIEIEEDANAASANPYDVAPALYMGEKGFGFIPHTLED